MAKLRLYGWGLAQLVRRGVPDVALGFCGGIGDDLLCTAAIHELMIRGVQRIWFVTRHPDLYGTLDSRIHLLPEDPRYGTLAGRLGKPYFPLSYSNYNADTDCDTPLDEHVIAAMCRRAGLSGQIDLRPYLSLEPGELEAAAQWRDYIVVQSAGLAAAVPMRTKQWEAARMQRVVDVLSSDHRCVQIGALSDPPLSRAIDLRGKTSLRQSAAVLAVGRAFIGLVGFLMHLARAVDCPAVIVYGGREPARLTGYSCNENVVNIPECSPCWRRNRCDINYSCLRSIEPGAVTDAADRLLRRERAPLAVDQAFI